MSKLYASVTGMSGIESISVSTGHSSSTATAQITTINKTVNIGDHISSIDIGYESNHAKVMQGYVKNIVRQLPNDTYVITVKDDLIRATDFFIVPTNPDDSFKRHNITAESLVQQVIALSGLTDFTYDATSFTFATKSGSEVEVKLTTSYDFCKMIADLLTWHLWCDNTGQVHFENRKPYVMLSKPEQVAHDADVAINVGNPIDDTTIINARYSETDRDLRNKVIVHGGPGIFAEAKSATSWNPLTETWDQILPNDFYKSMALISHFIDNQSMADKAVDYNLDLYNKLTVSAQLVAEGNPAFLARNVIEVDEAKLGLTGNWYIFLAEHNWSRAGYTMELELRK